MVVAFSSNSDYIEYDHSSYCKPANSSSYIQSSSSKYVVQSSSSSKAVLQSSSSVKTVTIEYKTITCYMDEYDCPFAVYSRADEDCAQLEEELAVSGNYDSGYAVKTTSALMDSYGCIKQE